MPVNIPLVVKWFCNIFIPFVGLSYCDWGRLDQGEKQEDYCWDTKTGFYQVAKTQGDSSDVASEINQITVPCIKMRQTLHKSVLQSQIQDRIKFKKHNLKEEKSNDFFLIFSVNQWNFRSHPAHSSKLSRFWMVLYLIKLSFSIVHVRLWNIN